MTDLTFSIIIVIAIFGGYCFGRAHAAWIHIDRMFDNTIDSVGKTLNSLDREKK